METHVGFKSLGDSLDSIVWNSILSQIKGSEFILMDDSVSDRSTHLGSKSILPEFKLFDPLEGLQLWKQLAEALLVGNPVVL